MAHRGVRVAERTPPPPTLKGLAKTAAALQKQLKSQASSIAALQNDLTAAKQTIAADEQAIAGLSTTVAGLNTTVAGHTTKLDNAAPLLAIAPYVSLKTTTLNSVVGPNVVFQGCNVHVRSTTSQSDATHSGNLVIGWNTLPETVPGTFRTGSNNLVVGSGNNFTSYGGFVAGDSNTISRAGASVSGGASSSATATCASISGGLNNFAGGNYSAISGGGGPYSVINNPSLRVTGYYDWTAGNSSTPGTPKYVGD